MSMPRFPQLIVFVVGVFGVVFLSLAFCGNLHLAMPIPGMSEPIGCSMSAEDHDALTLTLSGLPGSPGYLFVALLTTVTVALAFNFSGHSVMVPSAVFRNNPERRDRLLAYLRRGLLNPKSF